MPATLFLDIETYSSVDLAKAGVYRYTESEDFEILMCAWARGNSPVHVAVGEEEIMGIPGLWEDDVIKVAHNAAFERVCFSTIAGHKYLDPEYWQDTMILGAEAGYPRSLESLAISLGSEQKDSAGSRLINTFCKPIVLGKRKGERLYPSEKPEEWKQFIEYCRQDVVSMRDIYYSLPAMSDREREAWLTDQRINDRGIPVDLEMANAAMAQAEENGIAQAEEIKALTGVENPKSTPQMLEWFKSVNFHMDNMRAETVAFRLESASDPTVRRVLELRQELALIASRKYGAAIERTSADGQLRGSFQFFGAHTGRWAGRGVQLQNLPSATVPVAEGDSEDEAIEIAIDSLMLGLGASAQTLKALIRPMFIGPFTVVDYSQIEARVLAWLAGEDWALEAFAAGRDIYTETAERMSTPSRQLSRKEGKVAVLALGYNGGPNSLRVMGAEGADEYLKTLVYQWRDANENIAGFWPALEEAFRRGSGTVGRVSVDKDGADRFISLPSGRSIAYRGCKLKTEMDEYGRPRQRITFLDPTRYPARTVTYGGKLTENITQAVARDILSEALVRLEKGGYEPVGHVHDEVLVLGEDVEGVTASMITPPEWAVGLPIDAAGFTCRRYRKG